MIEITATKEDLAKAIASFRETGNCRGRCLVEIAIERTLGVACAASFSSVNVFVYPKTMIYALPEKAKALIILFDRNYICDEKMIEGSLPLTFTMSHVLVAT